MNEVQKAAIARADAKIKPALELYAERNRGFRTVARISLEDLRRVNDIVARLTDDDLRLVVRFAEGLAEWHDLEQPLSGATKNGGSEQEQAGSGSPAQADGF